MLKIILLCFISLATACGNQFEVATIQARQLRLKQLIPLGKQTSYRVGEEGSTDSLGLSAPASAASRDPENAETLHINFATHSVPALKQEDIEQHAVQVMEDFVAQAGINAHEFQRSDLEILSVDGFAYINFSRRIDETLVRDAKLWLVYQQVGTLWQLRELHNRAFLSLALLSSTQQTTSSEVAEWYDIAPAAVVEQDRRYLAMRESHHETEVGLHPAQFFIVSKDEESWAVTVSEASGDIIEAYPLRYTAFEGRAEVHERNYLSNTRSSLAISQALWRSGSANANADADGIVSNITESNLQLVLQSDRVQVKSSGSSQNYSLTVGQPNAGQVTLKPQSADLRALNSYIAISRINSFARAYLKNAEAPLLNRAINVRINVSGSCNAYYDGGISLYAAGGGCANLAEVNDVIYHEWGHGLDDVTGLSQGIQDGAFSEGIGDILSSYYIGSATLAPGFQQGSSSGIRNLLNNKRYPNDKGEVHAEGLIIGGAFWDMREALIARYGAARGANIAARLFFRHLVVTDSYLDSYNSVLRLDDDDADSNTRSPNHCLINAAFAKHGLATALNCSDSTDANATYGDQNAVLGVTEINGDLKLLASHPSAVAASLCFADAKACREASRSLSPMTYEGVKGNLNIFSAKPSTPLQELGKVSLVLFDKDGKEISWRNFAFKAR